MKTATIIVIGAAAAIAGAGIVISLDRLVRTRSESPSSIATTPLDWCAEHGVPESACVICHPDLLAAGQPSETKLEDAAIRVVSRANPLPRAQRSPSVICATADSIVQLADPDVARKAGFVIERVETQPVTQTIECSAELAFDGNRVAHLSPRADGVVQSVTAQVGDNVAAGDVLAVVDSTHLGDARATYLQTAALEKLRRKEFERQVALSESGVTPRRELQDAETRLTEATIALSAARQRLRNLGLSDEQIDATVDGSNTISLLPIVAPFAAVVVDRHAALGEVVDPRGSSQTMFTIADTSRLWAMMDVYEQDAPHVRVGQKALLTVQGLPGETFAGTITWIAPNLDPRTRTVKARAEIDNAEGMLRANMFGRAKIIVRDREEALLVPMAAVQWEGCCNVVFVKQTDTVYQPYRVRLGRQIDDYYVVDEGLDAGESIVTQGSFLLKTEILKGSIGAGCCEVQPGSES
jgi:cobalt-zinc-cadmium efflux system membrane fusion protein